MLLSNAVDASDALFHLAGVPGQVIVDEGAGRLQVQALASCIGAHQDSELASGKPVRYLDFADGQPPAAIPDLAAGSTEAAQRSAIGGPQLVPQILHGICPFGKDQSHATVRGHLLKNVPELDQLAVGVAQRPQSFQESLGLLSLSFGYLGVGGDGRVYLFFDVSIIQVSGVKLLLIKDEPAI